MNWLKDEPTSSAASTPVAWGGREEGRGGEGREDEREKEKWRYDQSVEGGISGGVHKGADLP